MFSKILVPVDFSEYTADIITHATQIALRFDSTIHLLHVIPNMDYFAPYESFMAAENVIAVQKGIEDEVQRDLENLAKGISGTPVVKAVRMGVSFVQIVEYVRTQGIELVVMATHGRGGLEHIIIGSVAEKVVRRSPCPVLTIRPVTKQTKDTRP